MLLLGSISEQIHGWIPCRAPHVPTLWAPGHSHRHQSIPSHPNHTPWACPFRCSPSHLPFIQWTKCVAVPPLPSADVKQPPTLPRIPQTILSKSFHSVTAFPLKHTATRSLAPENQILSGGVCCPQDSHHAWPWHRHLGCPTPTALCSATVSFPGVLSKLHPFTQTSKLLYC